MRIQILQHAEGEWIGSMHSWFANKGYDLTTCRLDKGEPLPTVDSFEWLLVMGGPMSVNEEEKYAWLAPEKALIRNAITAGKKVLGICLGGQLIAAAMGAPIRRNKALEIGWISVDKTHPVASWLHDTFQPLSWHGDTFEVPEGATSFAKSHITPHQGFCLGKKVWALQFHLEAESGTVESFLAVENEPLPDGPYVQSVDRMVDANPQIAVSEKTMKALLEVIDSA